MEPDSRGGSIEVFRVALVLGLTSFGGPIAHLGYFHREYVERRRWLAESTYLDLVALCQFLPGPASSQLGIGIGLLRAGWAGALAAWLGFTLPSAVALTGFALFAAQVDVADAGWVHGLMLAAVAIVAAAVVAMWRAMAPDPPRQAIALAAAAAVLVWQTAALQLVVIAVGGLIGWRVFSALPAPSVGDARSPVGRRAGIAALDDLHRPACRLAAGRGCDANGMGGGVRKLLPRRGAGLRRRPRGAAAAQ